MGDLKGRINLEENQRKAGRLMDPICGDPDEISCQSFLQQPGVVYVDVVSFHDKWWLEMCVPPSSLLPPVLLNPSILTDKVEIWIVSFFSLARIKNNKPSSISMNDIQTETESVLIYKITVEGYRSWWWWILALCVPGTRWWRQSWGSVWCGGSSPCDDRRSPRSQTPSRR